MRRLEELLRRLTVSFDHGCSSLSLHRVTDGVEVEAVVGGRMKDVDGLNGGRA